MVQKSAKEQKRTNYGIKRVGIGPGRLVGPERSIQAYSIVLLMTQQKHQSDYDHGYVMVNKIIMLVSVQCMCPYTNPSPINNH